MFAHLLNAECRCGSKLVGMTDRSAEFIAIAAQASEIAEKIADLDTVPLDALENAAKEIGRSWSKSNLGYQANVYYENYEVPPAGAIFSREWGFDGLYHGTTGDWEIRRVDEVKAEIEERAGKPDLSVSKEQSDGLRPEVEKLIQRARSVAAKLPRPYDDYVKENVERLDHLKLASESLLAQHQMQGVTGQFITRDMQALEGGAQLAGHQVMIAKVRYIRSPYRVAESLATICERLGMHLEGEDPQVEKMITQLGNKVFIGHGGASADYQTLGIWLTDQGLEWEVFDRKPTAGMSIKERLTEMLNNAQIAFLLMTSEDETAEGKSVARANVIHEVGLFQGRLGWMKAIILLEEGCEEFSNIVGVGQIRYPKGNIKAVFDDIRQVLVRENVL